MDVIKSPRASNHKENIKKYYCIQKKLQINFYNYPFVFQLPLSSLDTQLFFSFVGQLSLHIPILFVRCVHFLLSTIILVSYGDQYRLSVEKSFLVDLTKVLLVGKHFLGVCLTILMGEKLMTNWNVFLSNEGRKGFVVA